MKIKMEAVHADCLSPRCNCMDGCAVQAVAEDARSAALEEAAKVMEGLEQEAAAVGERLSDEGQKEDAARYGHYRRAYGSAVIAMRALKQP